MTGNMAVDVDCTWHSRNVSRHCLNVQADGCGFSAKALPETAFRAAHTLKGICLNLGFDNLFAPSQELTEKLRGATTIEGTDELFAAVEKEYDRTCEALRKIA